jgi:hypothetical protein
METVWRLGSHPACTTSGHAGQRMTCRRKIAMQQPDANVDQPTAMRVSSLRSPSSARRRAAIAPTRTAGLRAVIKSSRTVGNLGRGGQTSGSAVYLCSGAPGANARFCRRQGLPGGVTALAPPSGLHAAWGLSSLAVKLIAVTVGGAGGGIPVGTIRMPPVSLVCIPAGLSDGRDIGRMPADPGWSRAGADITRGSSGGSDPSGGRGPGTPRRSRLLWSLAGGAQEDAAAQNVGSLSRDHTE